MDIQLEISDNSKLPKYKQIIRSIEVNIELGTIKIGQKLPSINEVSFEYDLSRDTVERAYNYLKEAGIINAVKGRGYFAAKKTTNAKINVLVLFNKLSVYKKIIYNAFAGELGDKAMISFFIYHQNYQLFEQVINEHLNGFHYYIIMPHFVNYPKDRIIKLLGQIQSQKLIFLDSTIREVNCVQGAVYQDFEMDIYEALVSASADLTKYHRLVLVFPENAAYPYPPEITKGFQRFCRSHQWDFEVIAEITEAFNLQKGTAYLTVEETDLVNLIKNQRQQGLTLAKDIGVVSYNDTPLKEILSGGISVVTTNFKSMGTKAAKMILDKLQGQFKNEFSYISRKSL